MRLLVTGATGFVGSAVAQSLMRHSHAVVGLVRDPAKGAALQELGAELAVGDMWHPETYVPLVDRVDAVVHAAQQKTAGRWTGRKIAAMHRSDAVMTRALAQACLQQDKLFVYSSGTLTHAGYGGEWIDEFMPPRSCQLAQGHADMEAELLTLHKKSGLRALIMSPGYIYGAGGLLQMMVELLLRQQYRIIGDGANFWSMVHVDDVGEAYALALTQGRPGDRYFLADDHPLTRRAVVDSLTDALGLARVGKVPGWLIGLLFGFPAVEAITASVRVRNDKTKSDLGWRPRHESFQETLPDVLHELKCRAASPVA